LILSLAMSCATSAGEAAREGGAARHVDSLLRELAPLGIDVIFSSDLVPPQLVAPPPRAGVTPLQRARDALAANGLALREIAPDKYVVVRAEAPASAAPVDAPLEEISVYASRYSISGPGVTEPLELSTGDIEMVPGSHDDALRALKSLPGLASNASGRPYIRGSLADDVLVRYDGITLIDPFHLKNFQSLISAIDPAGVERIEVFSGGFPVRFGTRSGGVIDVSAPEHRPGYENRAGASLISAGLSTIGHADTLPLDWLFAVRRSTVDLLEPVENYFGKPQFSDSLGRVRWSTEQGAWTLGWLLLDDRIELGSAGDAETADATYRDEYLWLARDHEFDSHLRTRVTAVVTSSDRHRTGRLDQPGVATGSLDSRLEYDRLEASNLWIYEPRPGTTYTFGAELASSSADYDYLRAASFEPEIAAGFGRPATNDLQYIVEPRAFTFAAHAALRRQWASFEGELGLRFDGQHYNLGGDHSQFSPRLNLRYDFSDRLRMYASAGRFTQPQHVEEWRVEEAQATADSAQVSLHSILGLAYEASDSTRWGFEAYTKRWTTIVPYFDNLLDPLTLTPDITPDRVRITPTKSEASGLEVNVRRQFNSELSGWGTFSWSRVADDIGDSDILRSWDQPVAATLGVAWQRSRLSLSALGTWHSGWPRTPFELTQPSNGAPGGIVLGDRNAERWGDFYALDLRAGYTWPLAYADFSLVLEVTNASNHVNECCAALELAEGGNFLQSDTDHWLPAIVNLGFSYRWRSRN
jgi:outer membrane receptor protein involved in Fe transport